MLSSTGISVNAKMINETVRQNRQQAITDSSISVTHYPLVFSYRFRSSSRILAKTLTSFSSMVPMPHPTPTMATKTIQTAIAVIISTPYPLAANCWRNWIVSRIGLTLFSTLATRSGATASPYCLTFASTACTSGR